MTSIKRLICCLVVPFALLASHDVTAQEGPDFSMFRQPIELNDDDVPAFPDPPEGFDVRRDDVAQGTMGMIEYDSKTVGTTRKMLVYTPPGYSADRAYPVLYLLHGIGGDETEWNRYASPDILLDNLIAEGKAEPMIIVMPNGRRRRTTGQKAISSPLHLPSRRSSEICSTTSFPRSTLATVRTPIANFARLPVSQWAAGSR